MPIKSDATKRWVELDLVLPGTPEQIWRAFATGSGMSAWFTPTMIEERLGGAVRFDIGEGVSSSGVVTAWQPPARFAYEEPNWSGEAPPVATEITITSRSGGRCVVRMVHSLYTTSDAWDDEIEGFEVGWQGFFEILRIYLRDFAGQPAATIRAMGTHLGTGLEAWRDVAAAFGVAASTVGERRSAPAGAPSFTGTVEHVQQSRDLGAVIVRLDEPGTGLASWVAHRTKAACWISIGVYLYGDRAAEVAAKVAPAWRAFVAQRFPAPTA